MQATRLAAEEPTLAEIEAAWKTEDDARALADAEQILQQGYLVATEFATWSADDSAVLPLPIGIASLCARPIDAQDPAEARAFPQRARRVILEFGDRILK